LASQTVRGWKGAITEGGEERGETAVTNRKLDSTTQVNAGKRGQFKTKKGVPKANGGRDGEPGGK